MIYEDHSPIINNTDTIFTSQCDKTNQTKPTDMIYQGNYLEIQRTWNLSSFTKKQWYTSSRSQDIPYKEPNKKISKEATSSPQNRAIYTPDSDQLWDKAWCLPLVWTKPSVPDTYVSKLRSDTFTSVQGNSKPLKTVMNVQKSSLLYTLDLLQPHNRCRVPNL